MNDDVLEQIWKSAPTRKEPLDMEAIMKMSRGTRTKVRVRNWTETVALLWVIAAFAGIGLAGYREGELLPVIGAGLEIAGAIYVLVQTHRRAGNLSLPAADAPTSTWLLRHREQLEHQARALRSVWGWYVAPLLPGMLVLMLGVALRAPFTGFEPHTTLVRAAFLLGSLLFLGAVAWVVVRLNRHAARKLDAALRELDA